MPLLIVVIAVVILLEVRAPGFLEALLGPLFRNEDPVRSFIAGAIAVVLTWTIPYSLGQTALARRQRDAAIDRAETQYQKDKGWL